MSVAGKEQLVVDLTQVGLFSLVLLRARRNTPLTPSPLRRRQPPLTPSPLRGGLGWGF